MVLRTKIDATIGLTSEASDSWLEPSPPMQIKSG